MVPGGAEPWRDYRSLEARLHLPPGIGHGRRERSPMSRGELVEKDLGDERSDTGRRPTG